MGSGCGCGCVMERCGGGGVGSGCRCGGVMERCGCGGGGVGGDVGVGGVVGGADSPASPGGSMTSSPPRCDRRRLSPTELRQQHLAIDCLVPGYRCGPNRTKCHHIGGATPSHGSHQQSLVIYHCISLPP